MALVVSVRQDPEGAWEAVEAGPPSPTAQRDGIADEAAWILALAARHGIRPARLRFRNDGYLRSSRHAWGCGAALES